MEGEDLLLAHADTIACWKFLKKNVLVCFLRIFNDYFKFFAMQKFIYIYIYIDNIMISQKKYQKFKLWQKVAD